MRRLDLIVLPQPIPQNSKGFEFFETWLDAPGPPPFTPDHSPAKALTDAADALIARLLVLVAAGDDEEHQPQHDATKGSSPLDGWSTYQVAYLLDGLFAKPALDCPRGRQVLAAVVGERWGVARSRNFEVSFRWSLLVAKFSVTACLDSVEGFLKSTGKQKYQLPVYRALYHNEGGGDPEVKAAMHAFARRVYQETRPALHANVRKYIAKTMNWREAEAEAHEAAATAK